MNIDQALPTFVAESRELLQEMEQALLLIASDGPSPDHVNAIFRAAHTVKGSAGLFGLDDIVDFTHVVEGVLDQVRAGKLEMSAEMVTRMLACGDHIAMLIEAVAAGDRNGNAERRALGAPLLAQLQAGLGNDGPAAPLSDAAPAQRTTGRPDHWHISLRFGRDVLRHGLDPLSFIRYLGTLGRIEAIATVADALPPAEELDPESCYLGFEIAFSSATADKAAIESVFEFLLEDCELRILPPNSRVEQYLELISQLPEQPARLGDILVRCGSVTLHELDEALQRQAQLEAPQQQRLGEILVEQGAAPVEVVEAALSRQKQIKENKTLETQTVRVDAAKLDILINQVGELIIAAAGANMAARRHGNAELQERNATLMSLIEDMRDSALSLRMVKIGGTFNRFQRVVHDVARELGKDIGLSISGEDTELDKTLVEKIGDPLTHLVRNAMDHGIEAPELRLERHKPARGTVSLNAFHDSGSIVIEVSDDGRGLDRERILAKGIERGLVEAGRSLSDAEVYALIFEAGFSTAERVTNLSGRGVGMDVVKRNIEALRGSVHVASRPGHGTTVSVRLPLTLAIINGFQVAVGKSVFVLPLEMVDECIEYTVDGEHDYTNLRGEVLPFIRLAELFGLPQTPCARRNIVVVKHASQRFGIVVDTLLGQAQTVIKPMAKMFGQVQGVSGSSILGSGEVALILDVPALMAQTQQQRWQAQTEVV
ncbi:chemotaxis protein CheA [Caldimonas brevitalea]|uniref:Chemotaxis protein CheA n=1 Tax=Caldimonas brevitalea TaxID=413882 RepID=A0A0G3BJV0_9BURK|nr:chemotaxis protein CheA [Caldimonas brevitalea]AKJ27671.1 chemotaxis protein CheA [Caldimonas brevitalea]